MAGEKACIKSGQYTQKSAIFARRLPILLIHYSLFTHPRIRDFWEVIGNSEE